MSTARRGIAADSVPGGVLGSGRACLLVFLRAALRRGSAARGFIRFRGFERGVLCVHSTSNRRYTAQTHQKKRNEQRERERGAHGACVVCGHHCAVPTQRLCYSRVTCTLRHIQHAAQFHPETRTAKKNAKRDLRRAYTPQTSTRRLGHPDHDRERQLSFLGSARSCCHNGWRRGSPTLSCWWWGSRVRSVGKLRTSCQSRPFLLLSRG